MSTVTTTKEELAQELRAARERIEILESAAMDLQHAQQELEDFEQADEYFGYFGGDDEW